jgi:hypothetical protein
MSRIPNLIVKTNFLRLSESELLIKEANRNLNRLAGKKYENRHFDGVISGYRECITDKFSLEANEIFQRIKSTATDIVQKELEFGSPHILDLRDHKSEIKRHVDSRTFGDVICGVCLISPCVMIFRDYKTSEEVGRILLPARSFYVQWDKTRYEYTHEIPLTEDENHAIDGNFIMRKRRISIMFRSKKNKTI